MAKTIHERNIMDKDHIKGAAKEASGSIKAATGKVTGDRKTEIHHACG